jgi:hypothetical protein
MQSGNRSVAGSNPARPTKPSFRKEALPRNSELLFEVVSMF